ncbi:MAG: hypothetical protein ACLVC5_09705, partial [Clostridia bacterium]
KALLGPVQTTSSTGGCDLGLTHHRYFQTTRKHLYEPCFWQFPLKISLISIIICQNTEPGRSILVKIQGKLRLYIRKNTKNQLCDLDSW